MPGLYFVGFFNVSGGANIRMMDVQAKWIAALAAGEVEPPDERTTRDWIQQERQARRARYPKGPRYGLELAPPDYMKAVAQELAKVEA